MSKKEKEVQPDQVELTAEEKAIVHSLISQEETVRSRMAMISLQRENLLLKISLRMADPDLVNWKLTDTGLCISPNEEKPNGSGR